MPDPGFVGVDTVEYSVYDNWGAKIHTTAEGDRRGGLHDHRPPERNRRETAPTVYTALTCIHR